MKEFRASFFGLSEDEIGLLKSISGGACYSISFAEVNRDSGEFGFRTSKIFLRTDQILSLESLDIRLADEQEAFRISIRSREEKEFKGHDKDHFLTIPGANSSLNALELLPTVKAIDVLWRRLEYPFQSGSDGSQFVDVPDGLLLHGARGLLLISQDDLPTWLHVDWDKKVIDAALARMLRSERIS